MANSVDPNQTAPIGAVCSGSTLFASILKFVISVWQLFAADDFSRRHFLRHFFFALGRLNEKWRANCMHYSDSADGDTQSETLCRQVELRVIHYAVMNDRHVTVHHITESIGIRVF